jgi:tetratricopeptide (TPR) repeat protein
MSKCVFWLLLGLSVTACGHASDPTPADPPVQPLVIGKSPPMPIATAADPTPVPVPDDAPIAATTTLAIPARDPRIARSHPRGRALVVTELQALENLFTATASTAPDRPALIRRVAEDYAELARSADAPTAASAHRGALKYYEMLVNEYPKYAQVDEAWYYAGLEHDLAGDPRNARRAYYQLIKSSPQSRLIPLAYFAFGEMFFTEAASDPSKDQLALQAYAEVLKYPPPGNVVYADAQRRVSEVKARANAPTTSGAGVTRP